MKWNNNCVWKRTIKSSTEFWIKSFPLSRHSQCRFSVSNIMILWITAFLCSPPVSGFPIGESSNSDVIEVSSLLKQSYISPAEWKPLEETNKKRITRDLEELNNDEEDNLLQGEGKQDGASLDKTGDVELTVEGLQPKVKRGLSYLTKYYSEAFLNNYPGNSGGGGGRRGGGSSYVKSSAQPKHDSNSSSQFYGTSQENGFSSVRRKLSLYPPLVSSTGFMAPWSRGQGSGRSTMRLRWGK